MALLTAFLTYLVKFVVMSAVVAGGFILGKKVRENKNKKAEEVKNTQSAN